MADEEQSPEDDPAAELRLLEREVAELRQEADELRSQIGDPGDDPGELADRSNLITSLETHEALIENFEGRLEVLRQRLAGE
jgi:hypothetical protein